MPKVDIFVPCYNYGRFLPQSVGSILDQSGPDMRVLILDDASTDDSREIAEELASSDPRVSVVAHARNRGHIATYNEGLEWASADYVLMLSADDLLAPGALERAVAIMDNNPDVVLTHGDCVDWRDDLPLPRLSAAADYAWRREDLLRASCATGSNLVKTPTAICRLSAQRIIGGYRPALRHSGDMEMWLRFAAVGSVARIDAVQAVYRLHSANMSIFYYADGARDFQQVKDAFDSFFAEYGSRLADGAHLRSEADRALAERAFWSGLRRASSGQFRTGYDRLRFAFTLDPRLRTAPPLLRLLQGPARVRQRAAASYCDALVAGSRHD